MEAVLSNPLIFKSLGKYLAFRDFAQLRLVNKTAKAQVNQCESFLIKTCQTIFATSRSLNECHTQDEISFQCKNIKLIFVENIPERVCSNCPKPLSEVLDKIKGIKISELFQGFNSTASVIPERWQSMITEILNLTPKLESFSININILSKVDLETIADWEPCILKKLEIYSPQSSKNALKISELDQLNKNFNYLASAVKNLQYFCFVAEAIYIDTSNEIKLSNNIGTILQNNTSTLWGLELMRPSAMTTLLNKEFPKLRVLKLYATYQSKDIVAAFIGAQPLLEILHLKFKDQFPLSVYDVVSQRASKLQCLKIKGKSFGRDEEPGDWEFLRQISCLENFEIRCPYSRMSNGSLLGTCNGILNCLPTSVNKIYIRGLSTSCQSSLIAATVLSFKNLTDLSLIRCTNSFDDDALQTLFSDYEFQRRTYVFEFSHCNTVTNYGITGYRFHGAGRGRRNILCGSSINNLTKLRKLTIKGCPLITDGALNKIRLPNLTYLDVSSNLKILRLGIVAVAKQCPRLETLRSSWGVGRELGEQNLRLLRVDDKSGKYDNDSDVDADRVAYYDSSDDNYGFDCDYGSD